MLVVPLDWSSSKSTIINPNQLAEPGLCCNLQCPNNEETYMKCKEVLRNSSDRWRLNDVVYAVEKNGEVKTYT